MSQDYDFFWETVRDRFGHQSGGAPVPLPLHRWFGERQPRDRTEHRTSGRRPAGGARRSGRPIHSRRRLDGVPIRDAGQLVNLEPVWKQAEVLAEVVRAELQAAERAVCRTASWVCCGWRLRQADHLLLAGAYRRAWRAYLNLARVIRPARSFGPSWLAAAFSWPCRPYSRRASDDHRPPPVFAAAESEDPPALRILCVIPGEAHGASMIFARRQAQSLVREGQQVDIFYLRSRTSLASWSRNGCDFAAGCNVSVRIWCTRTTVPLQRSSRCWRQERFRW